MQLKKLFYRRDNENENKEKDIILNIEPERLLLELSEYTDNIRFLKKRGFLFSMEENKFTCNNEAKATAMGLVFLGLLFSSSDWIGLFSFSFLTSALLLKYFSQKHGIFKEKIEMAKVKTETIKVLFHNDLFKKSLLVNIEKNFLDLKNKFIQLPGKVYNLENEHLNILEDLKYLMVQESHQDINKLFILLNEFQEINNEVKTLLKIDVLTHEVNKELKNF